MAYSQIMSRDFCVGDRVCAKATHFDKKPDFKWCKAVFGDNYLRAVCNGTITKIDRSIATVLWDLDNKTMKIDSQLLKKLGKYVC